MRVTREQMQVVISQNPLPPEPLRQIGPYNGQNQPLEVPEYLTKHGREIVKTKPHGNSTLFVLERCVFDENHSGGEAAIGQNSEGKLFYQCFHDSCQDKTWHEARDIISGDTPLLNRVNDKNRGGLPGTTFKDNPELETEEWQEPLPLIIQQQATPYPLDVLPGVIGAAVSEVVSFVQCPVVLGACSALAVVSTVGQGLVDIRRACKLDGPTSLYFIALADSGERKTTVDQFFSKPVQQWEAERSEAAEPDLKQYEAENQAWEAKKTGLISAIKKNAKDGKDTSGQERDITDLEFEKPEKPKVPRLLFSDATPEALAYRLKHHWPVGGVLSSEAGIVFGGHAMGRESAMRNMALTNSLWGAESMTIDRRSAPSYTLRNVRLTMGLAVQPEAILAFLDASKGLARGIGFLARFLIAWPESTQGNRMYREPPEHWHHLAEFHRRLGTLLDLPLPLDDRQELSPVMLELSKEAKAIWVAFHDDVEAELKPGRDMSETRDVASKAADNAARLATLFHLFENGPEGTIGADNMKAASTIAAWHLYEARRFMGEIALPVEKANAAKLDKWLLDHCQKNNVLEVTTTTIQQMGPSCTRLKRTLTPAIEELSEAGRVRQVEEGQRKLVKINPLLLGGSEHGTK